MLQVPPAGPPSSRPALKAPAQDPAEEGFPALALLASAALPGQAPPPDAERSAAAPSKVTNEAGGVQPIRESEEPAATPEGNKQESPGAVTSPPAGDSTTAAQLPFKPEAVPIATDLGLSLIPAGPAAAQSPTLAPGPLPSPQLPPSPVPVTSASLPPTFISPSFTAQLPELPQVPGKEAPALEIQPSGKTAPSQAEPFGFSMDLLTAPPPPAPSPGPIQSMPADGSFVDPAFAAMQRNETALAPAAPPPALTAQVSKAAVDVEGTPGSREAERVPVLSSLPSDVEPGPVARLRSQRPATLAAEAVRETNQPAGFFAATQDTFALPQSGLGLNARLPGPAPAVHGSVVPGAAVPGKPPEGAAPAKESPKQVESPRGAEEARTRPAEAAASPAETAPATQGPKDPAPVLPRSESLGLQPTQPQPTGILANSIASKPAMPIWQAPVPAVLHQVENGIRWMLQNASPGAELQLHPEALGRVRIELKVEGGEVHARLWASDPKSIPVLQENKAFLEVSLKEQGLNLGSFDLRQHSNQPQPQNPEGQPNGQFWPTEAARDDRRQDAPSGSSTPGRKARRVELIA